MPNGFFPASGEKTTLAGEICALGANLLASMAVVKV
jgi:hypothetical protein